MTENARDRPNKVIDRARVPFSPRATADGWETRLIRIRTIAIMNRKRSIMPVTRPFIAVLRSYRVAKRATMRNYPSD